MAESLEVLVPTYRRPAALAATLATLVGQTYRDFAVTVSDQTADATSLGTPEVQAVLRLLAHRGHRITTHRHRPRRGIGEHRQFLLDGALAPMVLFLDDDVLLEPDTVTRLVAALEQQRCGFIGAFVEATSAVRSAKPADQLDEDLMVELWDGPVQPEVVLPHGPAWDRHRLHWAAHPTLLAERLGITREHPVLYKVAWIGGCVLYDAAKLRAAGSFRFWDRLPSHAVGEDVVAQLRVMARFGGAGLMPSGAWHQEAPTTLLRREIDAPFALADVLELDTAAASPPPHTGVRSA